MLDDKKRAEFEQSLAGINEIMPAMWWSIYTGCITQGFSPTQAFVLLQTQILASCSAGINGTRLPPDINDDKKKPEDDDEEEPG